MNFEYQTHRIETPALSLSYFQVPWDTEIFGFPVAQISEISAHDPVRASADLAPFLDWLRDMRLASCRLPHDRLRESMLLEDAGFRFVEMVLHPHLTDLQAQTFADQGLSVELAEAADLPSIEAIAVSAFGYERFHIDPRLDPALADRRYRVWVQNSYGHPNQRLLKISEGEQIVAFFVTETRPDGDCYWHLTAVAPSFQGRGYGKRVWLTMLRRHQLDGDDVH